MVQEIDNILRIMKESRQALDNNDSHKLKILSDQTLHTATLYQDADNVIVAVLTYTISKIVERENYRRLEGWEEFHKSLIKHLDEAIAFLEKKDSEKFMLELGKIRNTLNKREGSLSNYIKDIFYKAELNKAFKLYEHGLSAERTANILGVSLWDLAKYMGQSTISESHLNETFSVKERIKLAEEFFK